MMFVMCFPAFVDTSVFAVKSSHNPTALFIVSLISILFYLGVFVYHFNKVLKKKRNPLKDEIHDDLKDYKELIAENK